MANLPRQDDSLESSSEGNSSKDNHPSLDPRQNEPRTTSSESIKAVAIYEVVKGIGALLGALALWSWHTDLEHWLITATASWQQVFGQLLAPQVDSAVRIAQMASKNWSVFLLLIFAYASLRFVEAYGLWQDKTWAYWFGVLGYGIFIPIELYYLIVSPFDWFKLTILVSNIIIVIVVYRNMKRKGLI
ncbi:hypothetical protein SC65A3_02006 [Psychrobacter sp. SC65A.3]|uniref:DUF2127 domain-containing protein n=1 Tax=Psychrobacter sp. SC65A.3 TaxID=2983299 RepID=UPI0021D8C857|nr:DUF2127 domain-containing protein [Psychrobacter sp. SC65A.3]WAI88531.1 hypothetical protein SC65A3_02006 [Psychrobacter sp. SC65A.3]